MTDQIQSMRNRSAAWRARLWSRRSAADLAAVRTAREAVAQVKPAVVVTGGSRGIGFALARRFLESGHATAIVARDAARLEQAAAELKAITGSDVTTILCDISQSNALDIITTGLSQAGFYLDVLVNNAGLGLAGPFVSHSQVELSRLIALNIEAVTRLTRATLPDMLARRRGGILNVASLGAEVPGPNQAVYYASKAYVLSLSEAIASEVSGQGVRISALLPGPVNTAFHEEMGAAASPYRFVLPAMTADSVARSAYRGFMFGSRVIVPGISNIFFSLALKILPHTLTVPLVYWLLWRPEKLSSN